MILRGCIVVVSDYLFFFVEHTSNGLEDFKSYFYAIDRDFSFAND